MSLKREQTLQSARRLFLANGFHKTSVDAIAADAGTTKMTVYAHFKTKDNLIIEVLREVSALTRGGLQRELAKRAATPRERILATFDVMGEEFGRPDFRGSLFTNAASEFTGLNEPILVAVANHNALVQADLATLCQEAGADHPIELADQLYFLIEGAAVMAQIRRESNPAALARRSAETLLNASLPARKRLKP